jgi:hypothetical protein
VLGCSLGDKTSDFPMGFGPVSVPDGCEVASVKAVLEASDYYKVGCNIVLWWCVCGGGGGVWHHPNPMLYVVLWFLWWWWGGGTRFCPRRL